MSIPSALSATALLLFLALLWFRPAKERQSGSDAHDQSPRVLIQAWGLFWRQKWGNCGKKSKKTDGLNSGFFAGNMVYYKT